jgi:hypothetical protein
VRLRIGLLDRIASCGAVREEHMTAKNLIRLLEEMMEIKIRYYAPLHTKLNPEVAKLLNEKRSEDQERLGEIREELVQFLDS